MLSIVAGVGAPDVSQLQNTDAPYYIATGRLTDLTSVAGKYRAEFPAAVWNSCVLNGHVYAVPWDIGPCAIYYKRSIFRRYGIDPNQIDTWDRYISAGSEILAKSGGRTKMLPMGSNDLSTLFGILLQQSGGQIFDGQGRIAIDSPQSLEALDVLRKMRMAGITSDVPTYSQEWMAGLTDDSVATYPGAAWLSGMIKDSVTAGKDGNADWGVFRLPAIEPGGLRVANVGGSVLVIPAQCRNKPAAWAFIEYALCSREGQLAQYRGSGIFPALLPALHDPSMDVSDPFFDGQMVSNLFTTDITKITPLNKTATWTEANGYLNEALSHWAATGMTKEDIFKPLAQTMSRRLMVDLAPGVSNVSGAAVK